MTEPTKPSKQSENTHSGQTGARDASDKSSDVVIIGGGPAGMSAALIAGRAMLKTVVVNTEKPRNSVTTASHGFLTRDGAHPNELLAVAKQQLGKYDTVGYLKDVVTDVTAFEGGFTVELTSGSLLTSDRVIIATGQRDELSRLELPGIDQVYGTTVYPCLFCDGFEHRGERLAIFGREGATHYAPMARLWSDDVVVFTNGAEVSAGERDDLETRGVRVFGERVRRLHSERGTLTGVELEGGERIERDAGFIGDDYSVPASPFAQHLGVTTSPGAWGMDVLDVDEFGRSSIPGLYVIGDAKTGFGGLVAATAEGAACAESIVHDIASSRWAAACRPARAGS